MSASTDWRNRIGLQTIIWGEDFPDGLDRTLGQIHDLGYRGVEFFQIPSRLGPATDLERLLEKHELVLLGFSGGSLEERVKYARGLQRGPKFLYIQKWGKAGSADAAWCMKALTEGHTLALHPHQYSPVDTYERAVNELKKGPGDTKRTMVLPDSAHLFLSKEKLGEILGKHGGEFRFLHLKDWAPDMGTSLFSYAGGFCELGAGIVPLESMWQPVLDWLQPDEDRWIIVEQDSSQRDPVASCRISMNWLHGTRLPRPALRSVETAHFHYPQKKPSTFLLKDDPATMRVAIDLQARVALDSARDVDRLYQTVLEELASCIDLKCATLWEISPRDETAILRSFWKPASGAQKPPTNRRFKLDQALSGLAAAEQEVRCFKDIRLAQGSRKFSDETFITDWNLHSMVSIPVPNRWNPNQPELLLNLFPQTLAEVAENLTLRPRYATLIKMLRPLVALAVERAWDEKRFEITHELAWLAADSKSSKELLTRAVEPLQRYLHCRQAKVFLLHPSGTQLEQVVPKPEKPVVGDKNGSLYGQAWAEKQTLNSGTEERDFKDGGSHLIMPIFRQGPPLGEVMGIIACEHKQSPALSLSNDFTITDEIVLDAAQAALEPHLARMLSAEARLVTMARINHELKEPLTIFRHATTAAREEMQASGWKFKKDHIGKARRYLELMEQVAAKSGFLKIESGLKLDRHRCLLFGDIIEPAIEDLSVYLEDRKFNPDAINWGAIRNVPALFVDKIRFQQVVFNLLANAIKYADPEPSKFSATITSGTAPGGSLLIFEDEGTGIPAGMDESIFREGVRGPNADQLNVLGDGIGLFMVREILKAHGAAIRVAQNRNPTRFEIFLPAKLTEIPSENQRLKNHPPPRP